MPALDMQLCGGLLQFVLVVLDPGIDRRRRSCSYIGGDPAAQFGHPRSDCAGLQTVPALIIGRSEPICGCAGKYTDAPELTGVSLVDLVFTGVVGPVRIVTEHGGGDAETQEDVMIAALGIEN